MKKLLILLLCSALFHSGPVFGWGREGHETIAKIAERNLTKRAKKRIEKYLGGHSIVYYAKWMDEYRKTPEYAFTDGWHTAPVDARLHYSDELLNPKRGNAIYGLESAIRILENYREQSDSTVAVNLKYVIHLVGDMHCPTHVKYPDVKGFNIYVDGRKLNYHGVWDSYVLDCNVRWSGMEFQHILDRCTKREIKAITAGSVRDWFHDCAVYCRQIYVLAQPDQQFKSPDVWEDFLNPALPIAERQILYAGYRLAHVLNELFG